MNDEQLVWADFVKERRKEQQILAKQLGNGLCSESQILHFENGKRKLPNVVMNRLLERLGIGAESFAQYADDSSYACWRARSRIVYGIAKGDYPLAKENLDLFEKEFAKSNILREQFFYRMKAMYLSCIQGDRQEIQEYLKKSLLFTVKNVEPEHLDETVLSVEELDTLLDYYWYTEHNPEWFLAVAKYIQKRVSDDQFQGKTFPKAIYYYYCSMKEKYPEWELSMTIGINRWLDEALEILRNYGSLMYMWEILSCRRETLGILRETLKGEEAWKEQYEENVRWCEAVEWICRDVGIEKETTNTAIYYAIRNVENISDVIRRRRKMLHMTEKELAGNDMDVKTVWRIENGKVKGQQENLRRIMERLHLPPYMIRNDLVVSSYSGKCLIDEFSDAFFSNRFEKANRILTQIESEVNMEIPYNKQQFEWYKCVITYKSRKITARQFLNKVHQLVEESIPWEALQEENQYFTINELSYFSSTISAIEGEHDVDFKVVKRLENYCKGLYYEDLGVNYSRALAVFFDVFQSLYGNSGIFDVSNQYCDKLQEIQRINKKVRTIVDTHYAKWWNEREEKKTADIEPLSQMLELSSLIKDQATVDFLSNKMCTVVCK